MHSTPDATELDYEHVTIASDELEDVELKTVDEELEQVSSRGVLNLMIFNNYYLRVRLEPRGGAARDYWVNLAFLDPEPVRCRATGWLKAAGALGALTAIVFGVSFVPFDSPLLQTLGPVAAILLVPTLLTLAMGVYRSTTRLVFVTKSGRAPVVEVSAIKPSREGLDTFLRRLETVARTARTPARWPACLGLLRA